MKLINRVLIVLTFICSPYRAEAATTIAVPNLDYKSTTRNFFYFEKATSHSNTTDTAHLNGSNSHLSAARARTDAADSSYIRTFHDEIHIQYGQLRGMAADIRAILIKNGFYVLSAPTHVEKPKQTDDFFDINKRIKAKEFGKADYVLYGIVSSLDVQTGVEPLAGTNTQTNIYALNIAVEFNLIDTKTFKTISAFTATASANDNKIGNASNPPNTSKIITDLSKNLAEEVRNQLAEQNIIATPTLPISSEKTPEVSPTPAAYPVTVYRHD